MKTIVVGIRGSSAAVLSDDGCIRKVKNHHYTIGQEVNEMKNIGVKKIVVLSLAACLMFALGIGAFAYFVPYTYVSVDVNPSVEYEANIFDKVISVEGVNDDGKAIVDEGALENQMYQPIDEAISATVDEIAEQGYLQGDGVGIVITTASDDTDNAEEMAEELEETANEACNENGSECTACGEAIGKKRVAEARELGVTPGKLRLVEKLIESSENPESINKEEWLNKPVKDIMAQTNANKAANKDKAVENSIGKANGKGNNNTSETTVCTSECTSSAICESAQNTEQNTTEKREQNRSENAQKNQNKSNEGNENKASSNGKKSN